MNRTVGISVGLIGLVAVGVFAQQTPTQIYAPGELRNECTLPGKKPVAIGNVDTHEGKSYQCVVTYDPTLKPRFAWVEVVRESRFVLR